MIDKLKGAWKSWTVWINSAVLLAIPFLPLIQDSLPQLQAYLPDSAYKWAMLAVLVVNIGLRFKTSTSLQAK